MDSNLLAHLRYRNLRYRFPQFFQNKHGVEYVDDQDTILEWERENSETIGVICKTNYEITVVDLIREDGKLKPHSRIIVPDNGVIIIPRVGDKFVFEDQYRHPSGGRFLVFPRGHGEYGATPEEDAAREIREELGGAVIRNLSYLGRTYPETNSNIWYCTVWIGDVDEKSLKLRKGFEGIENILLMTERQVNERIAMGGITCGYTLAAWALFNSARSVN